MRKNAYTGEVILPLPGEGDLVIRFTWRAIAALRSRYGEDWEVKFRLALNGANTQELAFLLATTAGKSEAYWLDKSPPLLPLCEALNAALEIAFLGAGDLPERPRTALQWLTQFWRDTGRGSGSVETVSSSGS